LPGRRKFGLKVTAGTRSGLGCARKLMCCCLICSTFCGSGFFAAATVGLTDVAALCETDGAALADTVAAGVALAVAAAGVVLAVAVAGVVGAVAAAGVEV